MAILVSDTSVVIELERGDLLEQMFRLSHDFRVPDLLFRRELEGDLGDRLLALGLNVVELSPAEVSRATELKRQVNRLSVPDTFAFSLAASRRWVLLTGDRELRTVAANEGIAVHGVLWMIDQLDTEGVVGPAGLHQALSTIYSHPRCRLPASEVNRILARLSK